MTHDHPRGANRLAQQTQTGSSVALVQQRPRMNAQSFGTATSTPGKPSIWHNSGRTGITTHSVQRCPPRGIQSLDTVTSSRRDSHAGTMAAQGQPMQLAQSPPRWDDQAIDKTTLTLEGPTIWPNNAHTVTANPAPQRPTGTNNRFAQQHAHQGSKQFVPTTSKHDPPNI